MSVNQLKQQNQRTNSCQYPNGGLVEAKRECGVAIDGVVRTYEARTALAFVALDASGERSFSFYRPPSADMLFRAPHFDQLGFEGVRLFHVCSNTLTEEEIARAAGRSARRS